MTPERIARQAQKRQDRRGRNLIGKILRAEQRQKALIELGKTVITTKDKEGVEHYSFPPAPPAMPSISRLSHIAAKTRKLAVPRKNRLTFKVEHTEALTEDASRTFAKEVDKILNPPQEQPPAEGFIPAGRVDAGDDIAHAIGA